LLKLLGSGFGADAALAFVEVEAAAGRVRCEPDDSVWRDGEARCNLVEPARYGVITIEVDGQRSAAYFWRKDRASVHDATRADGGALDALPTHGGTKIVFSGARFGTENSAHPIAARATYQAESSGARVYDAVGCTVSAAYDRVECATSPGLGQHHVWRLFVDGDVIGRVATTFVKRAVRSR